MTSAPTDPAPSPVDGDAGEEDLRDRISRLSEHLRTDPTLDDQRRLLSLLHAAGTRSTRDPSDPDGYPTPAFDRLPEGPGLPDFQPADVTPDLMRAAILRDGCMVVRGFVDPALAVDYARGIDKSFKAREEGDGAGEDLHGFYEEFRLNPPYASPPRGWIKSGGAVLAVDSPSLFSDLIRMFERARVPEIVEGYLGAPPVVSVEKTNLRKVEADAVGTWHQDGSFMGVGRALNLWISLSHCGDDAPGLEMVPRRLDALVPTGTEGTFLPNQVSDAVAVQAAAGLELVRPRFAPGDAVFFDDLFLHRTFAHSEMVNPRYAIECWFFTGESFPAAYAPFALP